jgi:NAD(P)H-nitrite reductase large subunit
MLQELEASVIVCHCVHVSHRQIDEAVRAGCKTVRDVTKACGAGRECGSCTPEIERRLRAATFGSERTDCVAHSLAAK